MSQTRNLFQHIEEISVVKEELQEKIYSLESEMKQVKFERDNKESQIVALKGQISKRSEEKVIIFVSNNIFPFLIVPIKEYTKLKRKHRYSLPVLQKLSFWK